MNNTIFLNTELNQIDISNTIKLLIYKENPSLLEKVDFDDEKTW